VLDTDTGRTDGDGRTAIGGWLAGGATSRIDGLDDITLYESKINKFKYTSNDMIHMICYNFMCIQK